MGSLQWLRQSGGVLSFSECLSFVSGIIPTLLDGFRLRRRAQADHRYLAPLSLFEPPDTTIIQSARQYISEHCHPAMVNHSYRTGYRTMFVLYQFAELTPDDLETAWAAALLHDVGLDVPPAHGDFSTAGVDLLEKHGRLAGWSEDRIVQGCQAIASNLCSNVHRTQMGLLSWAMNVGGLGEVTYGPHRALVNPERVQEFEARYPRQGFRNVALKLIDDEARRIPRGRFALARSLRQ